MRGCDCKIVPCEADDLDRDLCDEATRGVGHWKIQLCQMHSQARKPEETR